MAEPTADELRRQAAELIARAEFNPRKPWISRAWEAIVDFIVRWWPDLPSFGGGSFGTLFQLLLNLAMVAGVVAVAYWIYTIVRDQPGRRRRAQPVDVDDDAIERSRSATEWERAARDAEATGQWRLALRARYRHLLAAAVEARVVDDVPGRTARQYADDLAAPLADHLGAITEATDAFEWAWYGGRAVDEAAHRRFLAVYEPLLAAVRAARRRRRTEPQPDPVGATTATAPPPTGADDPGTGQP